MHLQYFISIPKSYTFRIPPANVDIVQDKGDKVNQENCGNHHKRCNQQGIIVISLEVLQLTRH